jgi:hypothetical protein
MDGDTLPTPIETRVTPKTAIPIAATRGRVDDGESAIGTGVATASAATEVAESVAVPVAQAPVRPAPDPVVQRAIEPASYRAPLPTVANPLRSR